MFCNANYIIYTENKIPEYRTDISTLWTGTSKALIIMKNLQNVNIQPSFNKFILTSSHSMPRSVCCFSCFFFFSARGLLTSPRDGMDHHFRRIVRRPCGQDPRIRLQMAEVGTKKWSRKGVLYELWLTVVERNPMSYVYVYIYICGLLYIYKHTYIISYIIYLSCGSYVVSKWCPDAFQTTKQVFLHISKN